MGKSHKPSGITVGTTAIQFSECEKHFGRKVFWGSLTGTVVGKGVLWAWDIVRDAVRGSLF